MYWPGSLVTSQHRQKTIFAIIFWRARANASIIPSHFEPSECPALNMKRTCSLVLTRVLFALREGNVPTRVATMRPISPIHPALRFRSPSIRLFPSIFLSDVAARCAQPVPSLSKSCPRRSGSHPKLPSQPTLSAPRSDQSPIYHFSFGLYDLS